MFLAPMAGITDLAFRTVCQKYGCGLVYTEMISAKALYFNDKKTFSLLKIAPDAPCPTAVQIFGSEPDIMASMAEKALSTGGCMLDINMGCPAPKIVNNGEGSRLMTNLPLAADIIREVSSATKVPVTVKFRKGWDAGSVNAVEFARMAEKNGAAAIAVHGRTRSQMYSGKADWDIIKQIKQAVDIPVIGNGDIYTAADAVNMTEYTGCDAIMLARGVQGNPFLFEQCINALDGKAVTVPSVDERIHQAIEHIRLLTELKGERIGVSEARKHASWYIKGIHNCVKARQDINKATTLDGMISALMQCLENKE